jgi:hypothetical protein
MAAVVLLAAALVGATRQGGHSAPFSAVTTSSGQANTVATSSTAGTAPAPTATPVAVRSTSTTATAAPLTTSSRTPAATGPATLSDYWGGTADWQLYQFYNTYQYGSDAGFGAGNMIVVGPGGAWYWFYRSDTNPGSTCSAASLSQGTVLRKSTNRGQSWGPQMQVVGPTTGTPWACGATDGDATWTGSQWVYLFQCLADPAAPGAWGTEWNVCAFHNTSADPTTGTWSPLATHPVWGDYPGGYDPWKSICTTMAKRCASIAGGTGLVSQAGTPSFFTEPNEPGWYFVDFHGIDTHDNLYQGIAKTQDFLTYVAGSGTDLPSDAIYSKDDSTGWNEPEENWPTGDIGGGGGGAVTYNASDGQYYDVVEATNSADCTTATIDDLGMLRASSTTQTVWSQPGGAGRENPIFYGQQQGNSQEQTSVRCTPAYPELFTDPSTGQTFLSFVRTSGNVQGVYVFALVRNLLANGTAWRCTTTAPWQLAAGGSATDSGVSRDGNWATDGGCYFGFDRSIDQRMALSTGSVSKVTLTGSFAARVSGARPPQGYQSSALSAGATVDVVLSQYNSGGTVLASQSVPVSLAASGGYVSMPATTVAVSPSATALVYAVDLPGTGSLSVLAGGMTVQPG